MNRWSDAGMLTWERAQIDKPAFTPLAFAQLRVQTPGFVGFQSHFLGLPSFLSFVSWLFILIIICALPKDILCCFLGIIDKNLTRIPVFNNQPSSDSHTKGLLTAIPLVVPSFYIYYFSSRNSSQWVPAYLQEEEWTWATPTKLFIVRRRKSCEMWVLGDYPIPANWPKEISAQSKDGATSQGYRRSNNA